MCVAGALLKVERVIVVGGDVPTGGGGICEERFHSARVLRCGALLWSAVLCPAVVSPTWDGGF